MRDLLAINNFLGLARLNKQARSETENQLGKLIYKFRQKVLK